MMIEKHSSPVYPPISALICENDYRSTSCGKLLPGGIEQSALYGYNRIAFSCFHIVKLLELASQADLHQTTGIFVTGWLLTGTLQVRILFEEPPKGHLFRSVAFQCV